MSFSASLNNGLAGLNAAKLRAEVLSFNIANAATEGYARRSVNLEAISPGGVRAGGVTRAEAGPAGPQLLAADSRAGSASVRADAARAVAESYGTAGDPDGLYAVYQRFDQAMSDLRLTPESGAAQLGLLHAAKDLSATLGRLDAEAQSMRLEADGAIALGVKAVNASLKQLAELNAEARRTNGKGLDTIAEKQGALIAQISGELGIRVEGDLGRPLEIRTNGGALLLGVEAHELRFDPAATASFELTAGAGHFSGLSVDGQDITPGTAQGISEGRLAGHFAVRDVIAQDFAGQADALATELADRLATADTTGADGLFVLDPGTNSAAARITVNAAVDPDRGGALYRLRDGVGAALPGAAAGQGVLPAIKQALEDVRPLPGATGTPNAQSFEGVLSSVASRLGVQALRAEGMANSATEARQVHADRVARLTAVDTDRELQDLMLVEQAFVANARVVSAVDEMLATLMEI